MVILPVLSFIANKRENPHNWQSSTTPRGDAALHIIGSKRRAVRWQLIFSFSQKLPRGLCLRRENTDVFFQPVEHGGYLRLRLSGHAEHGVEHMPARLLDAGACVRSGDHAENNALIVPRAEVAGVGMYLLTPHAGKRRFFRSGKQMDIPADKVHVVRAGEALRFELREKPGMAVTLLSIGNGRPFRRKDSSCIMTGYVFLNFLKNRK